MFFLLFFGFLLYKAEIKDKLSKWVSLILMRICSWILFLILNWKSKVLWIAKQGHHHVSQASLLGKEKEYLGLGQSKEKKGIPF